MRLFSAAEPHIYSDLVSCRQKFLRLFGPEFKIVLTGSKSNPDSFHFNFFLFLSMLALALFALVLEFPKVHNPAYGRLDSRGNLNQVQSFFLRQTEGLGGLQDPEVFPVLINDPNGGDADVLIYAIASLDRFNQ